MGKKKEGKTNRILIIFAIAFILAGLTVLFLPIITNWLYNEEVKKSKDEFFNIAVSQENELLFQELYNELKARNDILYISKQKDLKDPFSYEQPTIDLKDYGLENNIIGFISIPKMEIEIPIYLGANTQNMEKGAVHLTETSYPIGGENTNAVIAAHRGYSWAQMFRHIEKLEIGDEVYIQNFRETLTYKVSEIKIIQPTDIHELFIQDGKDMITLITCHPYRENTHRYVVYCERL